MQSLNYLMNDRHLRRSILQQFGVFDVKKYFPKLEREALAIGFPYFENEKIYATKFRALEAKAHTQDGGGANTLFGQHRLAYLLRCLLAQPGGQNKSGSNVLARDYLLTEIDDKLGKLLDIDYVFGIFRIGIDNFGTSCNL